MNKNNTSAVMDVEKEKFDVNEIKDESDSLSQSSNRPPKDVWDKIAALAPIISGMLIFVMGGYFTYSYNQQQLRVQEIQTIEKFIPHLMGNDQSKRAAILAISSLTNAELAGKFAQIFASQGTVSALQSMAESGSESDRSAASTALAKALENIAARESKLNEMETAFQQALNEKNGQAAPAEGSAGQIEEADRLEHLADMCRSRGQLPVAESLLKQAVNIRIRVQLPSGAAAVIASLKKLSEVEQAAGNKEEADNSLKKVALIEAKLGLQSQPSQTGSIPPPPPPPQHDGASAVGKTATVKSEKEKTDGENNARDKDGKEPASEGESKSDKESSNLDHERGLESGSNSAGQIRSSSTESEPVH